MEKQGFFQKIGTFFKNLFVKHDDKDPGLLTFYRKPGTQSLLASLICIFTGIIAGVIVMIIISLIYEDVSVGDAFRGFGIILKGPFNGATSLSVLSGVGNVIFYSVPLIMTGLSVGIAFKTGLFNIGAPGQYIMGTIGSLLVALSITPSTPFGSIMVWILAIIVGMVCGALWGCIPGILKAFFNINEVIICIMTNWIAANLASWIFSNTPNLINYRDNTKSSFLYKNELNGTPKLGLDKLFKGSYIDISIILAILIAILIFIILNKTTFGYQLKACGHNRNAAKYAGLNEKRNIILSMAIAGALAGLGACFFYLNPGIEYKYISQYSSLPAYGFNGIASAFLANCNPIGIVFSSVLIRYLNKGGECLVSVGFNRYVADIVVAFIIYLAGFTRIIREILSKRQKKQEDKKPINEVAITTKNEEDVENG